MSTIVEHRRNLTRSLAQLLVLHDDDGNTSHREVLLSTGIDSVVLAHVNRTAHEVRRHIGNHRHIDIEILADFSTVDGIVGRDVQIVGISGNSPTLRDEGIVGVSRRSHLYHLTEKLSFLHSLLCPYTSVQVSSLLNQEVERNHTEFQTGATTKENH